METMNMGGGTYPVAPASPGTMFSRLHILRSTIGDRVGVNAETELRNLSPARFNAHFELEEHEFAYGVDLLCLESVYNMILSAWMIM